MAIGIFVVFVVFVLWLSFYFAKKTRSSSGYFAAGGQIHWGVNGIAFAGDYLSAASFLGICGMIATAGYDGFLYSIGYLAGWIVALFVVAEPMKRLGKYTFTDALDSKFNSPGIKLAAAVSTLVVSIFYLIPQMVGAGVLVEPLLGIPHYWGVIMVGAIVITIVATAGMTSTTYVQFLKGGLLIIFSTILVIATLFRGFSTDPDQNGQVPFKKYVTKTQAEMEDATEVARVTKDDHTFVKFQEGDKLAWWMLLEPKKDKNEESKAKGPEKFQEIQWVATTEKDGKTETIINGEPKGPGNEEPRQVGSLLSIEGKSGEEAKTGSVGPFKFLSILGKKDTKIQRWKSAKFEEGDAKLVAYYPITTPGNEIMRPGLKFKVGGTFMQNLDFISLMLALFCGTAALPHILIRYYTVPNPAAARKSTIVAIAAIGFFYILTMYMGLGAMVNAVVNPETNNMSAPLLARSFGTILFAVISAIAFATVLGTVSGLIVAASGAVAHDLMDRFLKINMEDKQKVYAGKVAAFAVGILAIILGILFRGMNVSFLVGWAFAVAASANLPAIIMLLFWKKTTAKGIAVSIVVGMIAAVGLILVSPDMYARYGLERGDALIPFSNPGIVAIPLSFITLVIVSLLTQPKGGATKQES
ncbi:MAG: cation acetate symporter [Planctomycetia bacterium]|jgi:cation/acetate symporter